MKRILAVEDDAYSRLALVRVLAAIGHSVREAEGGRKALDLIAAEPPDIVITDWQMPDGDGLELCRNIRARSDKRYIYVIVLTGRTDRKDVLAAFEAGADEFLTKPLEPSELRARIRAAERILELEAQLATKVRDFEQTLSVLNENHARLVEAERLAAVGAVALTVRHEINNPLAGILGSADLALGLGERVPGAVRESLGTIRGLARRIADIIARIEAVKVVQTKEYLPSKPGSPMLDLDARE